MGKRLFPFPHHPDQLCSKPNLLANGHYALFTQHTRICVLKLTIHLLLVLRLKMSEAIFPLQKYTIVVCKGKLYFNLLKYTKKTVSQNITLSFSLLHCEMSTKNLYLADSKQFATAKWSNLYVCRHDMVNFNSNKKRVAELRF